MSRPKFKNLQPAILIVSLLSALVISVTSLQAIAQEESKEPPKEAATQAAPDPLKDPAKEVTPAVAKDAAPQEATAQDLAAGALLPERTKLKARIEKLKASGVGIKPYQDALSSIEESVAAKEPDEQIQKSIERLNSALDQQMQSKAAITSNSYYHVHGSTTAGHSSPATASAGGGGGGGGPHLPKGITPELIEKTLQAHPEYRQRYEDYKKNGHL